MVIGILLQIYKQWQESIDKGKPNPRIFIDYSLAVPLRKVSFFLHTESNFDTYQKLLNFIISKVIYQRQTQKNNLASFSDGKASSKINSKKSTRFTPEELRDCFTLKENCACDTKRKIGGLWKEYSKSLFQFMSSVSHSIAHFMT